MITPDTHIPNSERPESQIMWVKLFWPPWMQILSKQLLIFKHFIQDIKYICHKNLYIKFNKLKSLNNFSNSDKGFLLDIYFSMFVSQKQNLLELAFYTFLSMISSSKNWQEEENQSLLNHVILQGELCKKKVFEQVVTIRLFVFISNYAYFNVFYNELLGPQRSH